MAPLDNRTRAALPDSAFAYIDSRGRRRLPINDAAHVRNALSRFEQTQFEDDGARERARQRLLKAARKFGILPIGFFDGQLRKERRHAEVDAKAARMARLPKGEVTFFLADVEGSTRTAARLGDAWPALLNQAWAVIRSALERAGGDGVDIRGDEYFAVFRRPSDAVKAAVRIQLDMSARAWPGENPLRVRIGLHRGTPTIADAAYAGIVVHTVARVCAAGHGGQILISGSVWASLNDEPIPGITCRELGYFMLAGLPKPEALYQVEAAGLVPHFPKLRARMAPARGARPLAGKAG